VRRPDVLASSLSAISDFQKFYLDASNRGAENMTALEWITGSSV